jgi:hypothetical protein
MVTFASLPLFATQSFVIGRSMNQQQWMDAFLASRQLQEPDGRPLYAYRCRGKEYRLAQDFVRQMLAAERRGRFLLLEPIFCLFAAETWRLKHHGGPWKWQTIFDAIDLRMPDYQQRISLWVERGLAYWRRPLLKGLTGEREFLLSIVCEGGLPLGLLRQEGAKLTRYFRELLEEYHRQGAREVETLARKMALLWLPKSLNQPPVFELSARLIESIVALQQQIPVDADDPIAALNQRQPGQRDWRDQLPLSLEDQTVEALLGNLVRQAQALERKTASQIRWRRVLCQEGSRWWLEQGLELPERISVEDLRAWTGWSELPARLRLLATHQAVTETVALLSLVRADRYRCEELRRGGWHLTGMAAVAEVGLRLSDGQREQELEVTGGQALGSLPWVFVGRGAPVAPTWFAEGSARTRAESAWVLAGAEEQPQGEKGAVERLAELPELGRTLYQVRGVVDFRPPQQDICRIQCAAEADSAERFVLHGRTLPWALSEQPVYQGIPQVFLVPTEGRRVPIPSDQFGVATARRDGLSLAAGSRGGRRAHLGSPARSASGYGTPAPAARSAAGDDPDQLSHRLRLATGKGDLDQAGGG